MGTAEERSLPTISDVAAQAGVSPATVSRVIQGAKNVRPATREKVQRAIDELGYVPSAVAQSLRSKRTRSLALVVSDITNAFWTTVVRGVEDEAHSRGYSVLLCNTDESLSKQLRYLDFLISQQVDGVIIAPFDSDAGNLAKLRQRNIPTVVVDRRIEGWEVDSVRGDSVSGARALVQHLVGIGHTRIAVISGPASTSTAQDRVSGYCLALTAAGLPIDPPLIKHGEYRSSLGEELTYQLLDEGARPTAIFATNNAIAMGVIDAMEKRGLRIPQDVALVSFDDLPDVSQIFPFLTVVAQPAYDMGVNASQLLLSRLGSEVDLRPRHVVLPSRLIVRHSCGSRLSENGNCPLSLPVTSRSFEHVTLIQPDRQEHTGASIDPRLAPAHMADMPYRAGDYDKSDVGRLLAVLRHREADRVPHIELEITSKPVYEYVLERELEYDPAGAALATLPIAPEDQVELALRLGLDAVVCNFSWRPAYADPDDLESPPSLAAQLSYFERFLRAAQGTRVGIIASFSSFFDTALRGTGVMSAPHRYQQSQAQLEPFMDLLLENQQKAMRVVCDRFRDDLALVMVRDDIAHHAGPVIPTDLFLRAFQQRMTRLIAPAKDHGKLLLMHTGGKVNQILPVLQEIGFAAVHPIQPEYNDIFELRNQWRGKLSLVGNLPTALLVRGTRDRIEARVRNYCATLAPGGGYVFSSSGPITTSIPPANVVAMTRAVHRHGRYATLEQSQRLVLIP
jgi:LacI family transcriptional regulator